MDTREEVAEEAGPADVDESTVPPATTSAADSSAVIELNPVPENSKPARVNSSASTLTEVPVVIKPAIKPADAMETDEEDADKAEPKEPDTPVEPPLPSFTKEQAIAEDFDEHPHQSYDPDSADWDFVGGCSFDADASMAATADQICEDQSEEEDESEDALQPAIDETLLESSDDESDAEDEDWNESNQQAMTQRQRAPAGPGIRTTKKSSAAKFDIRKPEQTKLLPNYAEQEVSAADQKVIETRAQEYIDKRKLGTTVQELLNSARSVYSTKRLKMDYAEVQACCAQPMLRKAIPETHAFFSISAFVEFRVLVLKGKADEEGLAQNLMTYLSNMSPDPTESGLKKELGSNRTLSVGGIRCCLSCFRALSGKDRSTFFRMKLTLKTGRVLAMDMRKHPSAQEQPACAKLMNQLHLLIKEEFAEPVPNPTTKKNTTLYEIPFTQRVQLKQHIEMRLGEAVSSSTLGRALAQFAKESRIIISFSKTKRFMKCDACKKFENRLRDAPDKSQIRQERQDHFKQVTAQRQYFATLRDLAKSPEGPRKLFLLSVDGMDQAKTTMPHQTRKSKATDAMEGLKVHVASVFTYGGDQPILGMYNLPDVSKNSSLVVTTIHHALNKQWVAHVEKHEGFKYWPPRLHICFDNAVGENLNQNVFGYLAQLVHCGIFLEVTVGTLLVGHTHNINDQLFSVWSRWLNVNRCMTLSEMKQKFESRYTGHVRADGPRPLSSDDAKMDMESVGVSFGAQSEMMHIPKDQPRSLVKLIQSESQKQNEDLRRSGQLAHPLVERLTQSANVAGWLGDLVGKRDINNRFKDQGKCHTFALSKDENGDTCLWSKFLWEAEIDYPTLEHIYKFNDVVYRMKAVMVHANEGITEDPLALPPVSFDTSGVRQLLKTLDFEKAITELELKEYDDILKGLDKKISAEQCAECSRLSSDLQKIGVIHHLAKDADDATKKLNIERTKARSTKQAQLSAHLDPRNMLGDSAAATAFREAHQWALMSGWWTDWTKTRVPLIQEHWKNEGISISRPQVLDPGGLEQRRGFLKHPENSSKEEKYRKNRTDQECVIAKGQPSVGQIVAVRAESEPGKPSFWLAVIRSVEIAGALPSGAAAASSSTVAEKKKRGKDQLESENAFKDIFECTHLIIDYYNHIEPQKRKKTAKSNGPNAQSQPVEPRMSRPSRAAQKPSILENSDEEEEEEDNEQPPAKRKKAEDGLAKPVMDDDDAPFDPQESKSEDDADAAMEEEPETSGPQQFRNLKYRISTKHEHRNVKLPVASAIWWGKHDDMLTKHSVLRKPAFDRIVQDLKQPLQ